MSNPKKKKLSYASNFPDPLATPEVKSDKAYGLLFAKAIENQWGRVDDENSLYRRRLRKFDNCRDYANGTQDTTIYRNLLTSLNPNDGDGSLLNLDYTPVPILPKFVRIAAKRIIDRNPYPNLEAVDPLSKSTKDKEKRRLLNQTALKQELLALKEMTGGMELGISPENLPDSEEEAEILFEANAKTGAEIAGQIGTNLTLEWNDFNDSIFPRLVDSVLSDGMLVGKRFNDPTYGIRIKHIDPASFIHSFTEDKYMKDLRYAGHIEQVSIAELKRLAKDQFTEEQYRKIATRMASRYNYDQDKINQVSQDLRTGMKSHGYDEFMVDVLHFEFLTVDPCFYEEKSNKHGNTRFHYEGSSYKEKPNSIYERKPVRLDLETLYGGCYILGTDHIFDYGPVSNIPKNIHNVSKARLSYTAKAVNMRKMMPKSMTDGCIGFADMLQMTHLKIQQSVAKAKPDGLMIDVDALTDVTLGDGGELQPLDLHDIYEKTGVIYYRSKDGEGEHNGPPVKAIDNHIRNINELIALYNQYLRMIRDTTGLNEVMDGSSPQGEQLVGVREQAMQAGNNALYDAVDAAMTFYKDMCEDVVKCIQILPQDSVVFQMYENAIGKTNMDTLSSFRDLPMYNFGVRVVKEMETVDKQYLEQNIQVSIANRELDIEDAIAIRKLKDVNQAERLLIVRRKQRIKRQQEIAAENSRVQAEVAAQATQAKVQGDLELIKAKTLSEIELEKFKAQVEIEKAKVRHEMNLEIEKIRMMSFMGSKHEDQEFKKNLEVAKEEAKDARQEREAELQVEVNKAKNKEENTIDTGGGSSDPIMEYLNKKQQSKDGGK